MKRFRRTDVKAMLLESKVTISILKSDSGKTARRYHRLKGLLVIRLKRKNSYGLSIRTITMRT
jgi:hypothetical protein